MSLPLKQHHLHILARLPRPLHKLRRLIRRDNLVLAALQQHQRARHTLRMRYRRALEHTRLLFFFRHPRLEYEAAEIVRFEFMRLSQQGAQVGDPEKAEAGAPAI